jgi:hypothetical protein
VYFVRETNRKTNAQFLCGVGFLQINTGSGIFGVRDEASTVVQELAQIGEEAVRRLDTVRLRHCRCSVRLREKFVRVRA